MANEEVLALVRDCVAHIERFAPWEVVESLLLRDSRSDFRWVERSTAEGSSKLVQPIPSAMLTDRRGDIYVVRRTDKTREDLRSRFSILFGGHVDRGGHATAVGELPMKLLFESTLMRELEEELSIANIKEHRPLGAIIDPSSVLASRHIAIVYEVKIHEVPTMLAKEEFALRSKYSGHFVKPASLFRLIHRLDPWSRILVEDLIAHANGRQSTAQLQFPFSKLDLSPTD